MRPLLLVTALLPFALIAQDHAGAKVNWTSLEQAQAAAKTDGKPILIDMWTPWCGWCKRMDAATFQDQQTADYLNAHFHCVSFNAEGPDSVTFNGTVFKNQEYDPKLGGVRNGTHDLTKAIAAANGQLGYPTIVYIAADGALIGPDPGYKSPEDIEVLLRYVREGAYKTTPLADYRTSFKSARKAP